MEGYQQRIVAYVDIVGWRAACNDCSDFSRLDTAVNSIADHARSFSPETKAKLAATLGVDKVSIEQHAGVEFSFFSDNFAISAPLSESKLVFRIVAWASDRLLSERFLIRGGIAIGNLHHKHAIVFGPALAEAVDLEKSARNPRILCSAGAVEFLRRAGWLDELAIRDDQEQWVANIAVGSIRALNDHLAVVETEIATVHEHASKWAYIQNLLPRMYSAKGIAE